MKRRVWIRMLLCSGFGLSVVSLTKLFASKKKTKILFVGDSITQHGGYIRNLREMLKENDLGDKYELINGGLSGETITGLTEPTHPGPRPYLFDRLEGLLEEHNPDIAYFCYGINCGIYQPMTESKLNSYKSGIEQILEMCRKRGIEPVLVTPPPLALKEEKLKQILANPPDEWTWKEPYPWYSEEVVKVFAETVISYKPKNVRIIDLYEPLIDKANQAYGDDPIHPNEFGHKLIADLLRKDFE